MKNLIIETVREVLCSDKATVEDGFIRIDGIDQGTVEETKGGVNLWFFFHKSLRITQS